MKKILLFLFFILMSVGSAFGASPSILIFTSACGGSGTDSDGNTWTVTSDAAESNYDATKGIHYGTNKKTVSYLNLTTSGISGTITEIQINASGASGTSAKLNVTIGGNAFGSQQSLTSSATTYTLTGSASGTIVVSITQSSATKALYCKSITVTYNSGISYTITALSNNESYGTVSLSGNVITGNPKTGYTYASPAYTVSPANSATVSQSGNTFNVTPSANTTVTINFTPITYTVTYDANDGTGTMTDSNSPYNSGATVTVLDNSFAAPLGKQFDHWNTAANNGGTSYNPGATFNISANTTLYAQWVDIPPTPIVAGKVYELVTNVNQLEDNDNIIILDIDKEHALSTIQNTNNRGSSTDYRLIMNKTVAILNEPSTVQIIRITANGDNWEFYTGDAGYLYAAGSGDNNNFLKTHTTNDENGYWEVTINNATYEASIVAQGFNSHNVMSFNPNNGNPIFACYTNESPYRTKLHIYKESSFSDEYTITFKNQLGPDSTKTQTTLGEIIKLPHSMNICNFCYGNDWNLAGWVTSLGITSPIYANDYIPTRDITLYALYGRGTEPIEVNEYKKVTESLSDWTGDYLIAFNSEKFADGRIGGTTTGGIGTSGIYVTPGIYLHGDTAVDAEWGDLYNITIEEISEGSGTYLLKTKDNAYNYSYNNTTGLQSTTVRSTAEAYPITIEFISSSDVRLSIDGAVFRYNESGFFRFYKNCGQSAVHLYKKQKVTKYASTEYSTAPECDTAFISTWGTSSISIPQEGLPVTNPTHVTIKNIEQGTTITERTSLSSTNGEYVISTPNLTDNSCDKMNILIEGTDSLYMIYKVPIIVSSNVNTDVSIFTDETEGATCDVVVLANKTLTVTGTPENRNVKIYEGGTLSVPSETEYTVNSLSLRRTIKNVPYFNLEGDITIVQDSGLYIDVYTDESDWNWMTLPAKFDIRTLCLSNGKSIEFGEDHIFKYYDGAYRAEHLGGGWQATSQNKVFNRGEGFIFGIDAPIGVKKEYRFKFPSDSVNNEKISKSVTGLYAYGNGTGKAPNHIGWNLIGNPFMSKFDADFALSETTIGIGRLKKDSVNGQWTGGWEVIPGTTGKLRYAVIPSDDPEDADAGGYKSIALEGDYDLQPFTCFFVQLGGNKDEQQLLTFGASGRNSIVARRAPMYDEDEELFLRIKVDNRKTGWFISNKFTNEYEPGDDLESKYPIYQLIDGFKYLYSAIPDSTLIEGVTVHSPGGHLILDPKVDISKFEYVYAKVGESWYNLLLEETDVPSGNFIIYAKRKTNEDIPTGIDVVQPTNGTYKFMKDNVIYINKNNKIYTIIGNSIQ